ncbi:unnamed protein product [Rhizophagus irregularis]|nr:unnamed protein product [Rhizophagus irregularis]
MPKWREGHSGYDARSETTSIKKRVKNKESIAEIKLKMDNLIVDEYSLCWNNVPIEGAFSINKVLSDDLNVNEAAKQRPEFEEQILDVASTISNIMTTEGLEN